MKDKWGWDSLEQAAVNCRIDTDGREFSGNRCGAAQK